MLVLIHLLFLVHVTLECAAQNIDFYSSMDLILESVTASVVFHYWFF